MFNMASIKDYHVMVSTTQSQTNTVQPHRAAGSVAFIVTHLHQHH